MSVWPYPRRRKDRASTRRNNGNGDQHRFDSPW
jgi:hypothetical protein